MYSGEYFYCNVIAIVKPVPTSLISRQIGKRTSNMFLMYQNPKFVNFILSCSMSVYSEIMLTPTKILVLKNNSMFEYKRRLPTVLAAMVKFLLSTCIVKRILFVSRPVLLVVMEYYHLGLRALCSQTMDSHFFLYWIKP